MTKRYGVQVKKALAILRKLSKVRLTAKQLSKETKIPLRTVYRILGILKEENFVEQDRYNRWFSLYEETRIYKSKHHYDIMLNHSKELIPALVAILSEDEFFARRKLPDMLFAVPEREEEFATEIVANWASKAPTIGKQLKEFAEQHLKTGYPHIYEELKEFREKLELCEEKGKQLRKIIEETGTTPFLPSTTGSLMDRFCYEVLAPKKYAFYFKNVLNKLSKEEIDEFCNLWFETCRLYERLVDDVNFILIRITMGIPLQGKCSSCPQLDIENSQHPS
ncbi:hypothetical protein J7K27_00640 [Candidatus Bathyarchaeota archaeon]|nr:hypothetical protein [Candidatus Bathyarchaeota archaeon]